MKLIKKLEILDKFQAKYVQGMAMRFTEDGKRKSKSQFETLKVWLATKNLSKVRKESLRDRPRILAKIEKVGEIFKRT